MGKVQVHGVELTGKTLGRDWRRYSVVIVCDRARWAQDESCAMTLPESEEKAQNDGRSRKFEVGRLAARARFITLHVP